MKKLIGTTILAAILLIAGSSIVDAQVTLGIRIGPPPRARVVKVQPRQPGPEYVWVDGYYYPNGNKYTWHEGYWTRPPYGGARWVGARYEGGMFYNGYWDGDRGRMEHDHRSDRDRNNRDYHDDNRR